jgi:hypothetical protein
MSVGHPTEHVEAVRFMRIVKLHERRYPELGGLFAIPNGGARHVAVAAKLKAEGVRPFVPDYFLPAIRFGTAGVIGGLFIELKSMTGYANKGQKAWIDAARKQGYRAEVCRGADAAWAAVLEYLALDGLADM